MLYKERGRIILRILIAASVLFLGYVLTREILLAFLGFAVLSFAIVLVFLLIQDMINPIVKITSTTAENQIKNAPKDSFVVPDKACLDNVSRIRYYMYLHRRNDLVLVNVEGDVL